MTRDLLRVRDLSTRFFTDKGQINAVESVDFTVREGEVFGIVGESGSGKSVTALSIFDLVASPGKITSGEIWYRNPDLAAEFESEDTDGETVDGEFVNLRELPAEVRRSLRGTSFGMVFQDSMTSLDPSAKVGTQIGQAVEVQRRANASPRSTRSRTQGYGLGSFLMDGLIPNRRYVSDDSWDRAVSLLDSVGIPDPEERAREYPHQFSGGMLQRAMVAQALAGEPDILVADEPTTALDVTIEAQILDLLAELQDENDMSIMLITHDLGVIARTCDRLGVMYAGEIVERGTLADVFEDSIHPYTDGLLGSIPDLDDPAPRLQPIEGNVPGLLDSEMDNVCYFADRCPMAMDECIADHPTERRLDGEHTVRCVLADREYDESKALSTDAKARADGGDDE